jgi:hypothetical protein
MGGDDLGRWAPLDPWEARDLFDGLDAPWWVAGGWAIDLGLGRTTRDHGDIDIEVLRRDQLVVQSHLRGWELYLANRVLTPWVAGEPAPADTSDDGAITRPMDVAVRRTDDGVPFLAPEVQLLMKAKNRLAKDDVDFANAAGSLDDEGRAWLRAGLGRLHPGHRWLDELG